VAFFIVRSHQKWPGERDGYAKKRGQQKNCLRLRLSTGPRGGGKRCNSKRDQKNKRTDWGGGTGGSQYLGDEAKTLELFKLFTKEADWVEKRRREGINDSERKKNYRGLREAKPSESGAYSLSLKWNISRKKCFVLVCCCFLSQGEPLSENEGGARPGRGKQTSIFRQLQNVH